MYNKESTILSSLFIIFMVVTSCAKDSDPDLSYLTIRISGYDIDVSERATGNTGAELNKPAPTSISFTLSCSGSATEEIDYLLPGGKVYTIEPGAEYLPIDWQIIDDDLKEGKENIVIRIESVEPSSISIEDAFTQLTINSNDE